MFRWEHILVGGTREEAKARLADHVRIIKSLSYIDPMSVKVGQTDAAGWTVITAERRKEGTQNGSQD